MKSNMFAKKLKKQKADISYIQTGVQDRGCFISMALQKTEYCLNSTTSMTNIMEEPKR